MPIYEFRCNGCGVIFEHLSLFKEKKICCSACGGDDFSKVLSASGCINNESGYRRKEGSQVSNCSCGKSDNCTTIKLPGYER